MVGINDALDVQSFSVGASLANLANISARPNFELQFNALQNRLLDQLVVKIEELNDDSIVNRVDVFLELEKKRMQRLTPLLEDYEAQTVSNRTTALGMSDDLTTLEGLASGGDATAFDTLLAQLDSDLALIKNVSGLSVGLNVKDGLVRMQGDGIGIGSYASYASDADRQQAVTDAKTKLDIAASVTTLNLDAVRSIQESVLEKIISTTIQIEAVQIADKAEKTEAIKQMRDDHSRLVKMLSLAFEVNQSRAEIFTQQLLEGPQFQPGTVLDLFT